MHEQSTGCVFNASRYGIQAARRIQILILKALFLDFISYEDDVMACDVHAVTSQLLNRER